MQDLPKPTKSLLSIGAASKALGVSIDTIRRWEKAGKIKVFRTPGGTRLISLEEIDQLKVEKKEKKNLSIGQAAKELGVSIQTLRRWDKNGLVKPSRTAGGTRLFSLESLQKLKVGKVVKEEAARLRVSVKFEPSNPEFLPALPAPTRFQLTDPGVGYVPPTPEKIHQKIINGIRFYRPVW